jgi:hypothetical protein
VGIRQRTADGDGSSNANACAVWLAACTQQLHVTHVLVCVACHCKPVEQEASFGGSAGSAASTDKKTAGAQAGGTTFKVHWFSDGIIVCPALKA